MRRHYGFDARDVILHKAPFSFDVSVWELFLPLVTGATLVVPGLDEHRDPARICALLQQHRITTVHFVPAMLKEFLAYPDAARCVEVTRLFSGGDALTPELQDKALRSLPGVKLHNRYGPTESADFCIALDLRAGSVREYSHRAAAAGYGDPYPGQGPAPGAARRRWGNPYRRCRTGARLPAPRERDGGPLYSESVRRTAG